MHVIPKGRISIKHVQEQPKLVCPTIWDSANIFVKFCGIILTKMFHMWVICEKLVISLQQIIF